MKTDKDNLPSFWQICVNWAQSRISRGEKQCPWYTNDKRVGDSLRTNSPSLLAKKDPGSVTVVWQQSASHSRLRYIPEAAPPTPQSECASEGVRWSHRWVGGSSVTTTQLLASYGVKTTAWPGRHLVQPRHGGGGDSVQRRGYDDIKSERGREEEGEEEWGGGKMPLGFLFEMAKDTGRNSEATAAADRIHHAGRKYTSRRLFCYSDRKPDQDFHNMYNWIQEMEARSEKKKKKITKRLKKAKKKKRKLVESLKWFHVEKHE